MVNDSDVLFDTHSYQSGSQQALVEIKATVRP